uniref:UPF0585 protein CG18661 n=1 Tax=Cacopsylla melanoneura TaxID=428564 RepID=A0A8D9BU73_9HEMI
MIKKINQICVPRQPLLKFCLLYCLSCSQMAASDKKQFYPAADRNKQPILDILKKHISTSENRNCLEIASGSGQHVSFFAPHFPNIEFHPSEECRYLFDSIDEYIKFSGLTNVKPARFIDASSQPEKWFDGTPVKKAAQKDFSKGPTTI